MKRQEPWELGDIVLITNTSRIDYSHTWVRWLACSILPRAGVVEVGTTALRSNDVFSSVERELSRGLSIRIPPFPNTITHPFSIFACCSFVATGNSTAAWDLKVAASSKWRPNAKWLPKQWLPNRKAVAESKRAGWVGWRRRGPTLHMRLH